MSPKYRHRIDIGKGDVDPSLLSYHVVRCIKRRDQFDPRVGSSALRRVRSESPGQPQRTCRHLTQAAGDRPRPRPRPASGQCERSRAAEPLATRRSAFRRSYASWPRSCRVRPSRGRYRYLLNALALILFDACQRQYVNQYMEMDC